MIEDLQAECAEMSPSHLIERVLEQTGYLDWVEQQDNLEHTSRADNLRELANAMAEATEQGQTLEDVLDRAALVADSDEYDETIPVSLNDSSQRQRPGIRFRFSSRSRRRRPAAQSFGR